MFCSRSINNKIHERCLRLIYNETSSLLTKRLTSLSIHINEIKRSLYIADILHCGHLYLTDTFLGIKPENYGQAVIKNFYVADTCTYRALFLERKVSAI